MLRSDIKKNFEELKKRAANRKKRLPSEKSEQDLNVENQNSIDLMPYVYDLIARSEKWI